MTKLSIITCYYGAKTDLQITVKSLVAHDFSHLNFEHIVIDQVNESSTDVYDLFPAYWPLKIFKDYPEPLGIYGAFNEGLKRASGDWIWFLCTGDELYNFSELQKTYHLLGKDIKTLGYSFSERLMREQKILYTRKPSFSYFINILGRNRISHFGTILNRKFYENNEFVYNQNFPIAADYLFYIKGYLKGHHVKFSREPLINFDMSGASSDWRKLINEFKWVHHELKDQIPKSLFFGMRLMWHVELIRYHCFNFLKMIPSEKIQKTMKNFWRNYIH